MSGQVSGVMLVACHDCGEVHRVPELRDGRTAVCARCSGVLLRHRVASIERALALNLAALLLFGVANLFPVMTMRLGGRAEAATLLEGVTALYRDGMWGLAGVVLLAAVLIPLLKLIGSIWVLAQAYAAAPAGTGLHPHRAAAALGDDGGLPAGRDRRLREDAGPGHRPCRRRHVRLRRHDPPAGGGRRPVRPARRLAAAGRAGRRTCLAPRPGTVLLACEACDQVVRADAAHLHGLACPRCGEALHRRKPDSLNRTWALALTAAILYVPANLLPVLTVISFGQGAPSTIVGGVIELVQAGMLPVALLVFFASITVPVLKLVGLAFLLVSVHRRSTGRLRDRTRLYRIVEGIGRWSMVDVFMTGILAALVALGNLATISPGPGAVAFCGVVIVTILAAMAFDPRLMWDMADGRDDGRRPPRV